MVFLGKEGAGLALRNIMRVMYTQHVMVFGLKFLIYLFPGAAKRR